MQSFCSTLISRSIVFGTVELIIQKDLVCIPRIPLYVYFMMKQNRIRFDLTREICRNEITDPVILFPKLNQILSGWFDHLTVVFRITKTKFRCDLTDIGWNRNPVMIVFHAWLPISDYRSKIKFNGFEII